MLSNYSSENKIAVFDFDGTLCSLNSVKLYLYTIAALPFHRFFLRFAKLLLFVPLLIHYYKKDDIKFNALFSGLYKGLKESEILNIANKKVSDIILRHLYFEGIKKIDLYKKINTKIIIISSNIDIYLSCLKEKLEVDEIICNKLDVENGYFTGKFEKEIINSSFKAEILRQLMDHYNCSPANLTVYGDSIWDIPMLLLAGQCCIINPSQKLLNMINDNYHEKLCFKIYSWNKLWFKGINPILEFSIVSIMRYFIGKGKNIPDLKQNKGYLVLPNHKSYLDHYFIGTMTRVKFKRSVIFIAKKEHFSNKFTTWLYLALGSVPIDREHTNHDPIIFVKYAIRFNKIIVIYPEGTRNASNMPLLPIKKGPLFLMKRNKIPGILLGINGTSEILPKGKLLPKRIRKINYMFGNFFYFDTDFSFDANMDIIQNSLGGIVWAIQGKFNIL